MSLVSNNSQNCEELECYFNILEKFHDKKLTPQDIELWKYKSYSKLMKVLKKSQKKEIVTNALILIINLFENIPPDIYNTLGNDISELSSNEKKIVLTQLKDEILPN